MKKKILFCLSALVFLACEHETIAVSKKIESYTYQNANLYVLEGNQASSSMPIYKSDSPVSFELNILPQTDKITINEQGVIKVDETCPVGYYELSVQVKNSSGSSLFGNVLKVLIQSKTISFDLDIVPLVKRTCGPCHSEADQNTIYTDYDNASGLISLISDRIQLPITSDRIMPPTPTGKLTQEEINIFLKWESDGLNH